MGNDKLPLIGITGDTQPDKDANFYKVSDKYILSVVRRANCLALMIPPIGADLNISQLLTNLDGILFTGSPSDLEPHYYGHETEDYDFIRDLGRDATNLPMLRQLIHTDLPLFCICRGHQELNVAFGGTLHQQIHLQKDVMDHRADKALPYDDQYGPRHDINILPAGNLEKINNGKLTASVNSLHGQAVDKIGEGLRLEAKAPDGVVEALSIIGRPAFNISVQWHPEHHLALKEPLNERLFDAFGKAARNHMNQNHMNDR